VEKRSLYTKLECGYLRAEREWSQTKLASQAGVTPQTINSIEKADVRGVLGHWLFGSLGKAGTAPRYFCPVQTILRNLAGVEAG
jgi:hypothetical protein